VNSRTAAGDAHITFIDGTELLGFSQLDGVVDGTHPNDLGFQWMADGISSRLREILHLSPR
jgi:lysophospholipase L1-like esterase